ERATQAGGQLLLGPVRMRLSPASARWLAPRPVVLRLPSEKILLTEKRSPCGKWTNSLGVALYDGISDGSAARAREEAHGERQAMCTCSLLSSSHLAWA